MIVEFAGLPGSGKTTIVRALLQGNPALRSVVIQPAFGALLQTRVGGVGAWEALRPGPAWPAWASLCARHSAQSSLGAGGTGTLLLEEGITHHVWRSRFLHPALDRRPWSELLDAPTPLVVLDLDRAGRFERIASKSAQGKVNRQLAAAGPAGETWDRADALFAMILAEAATRRPVTRISTAGSVPEACQRVQGSIDGMR